MKHLRHLLASAVFLLALLVGLTSCEGSKYKKIDGKIYWTFYTFSFGQVSQPLDADTLTFQDLGHHYGKDKDHAFYEDSMLAGADVATFESVKDYYAIDARHAYYKHSVIQGADPTTFKVKNENLSCDDRDYYWQGKAFGVSDMDKFKVFYFVDDDAYWARDSKYGYYIEYNGPIIKFPIANYKDFEPLTYKSSDDVKLNSCDYATDGEHIYYRGKVMCGVDVETFRQTDYQWAEDKRTRYYQGLPTDSIPVKKQ